MNSRPYTVHIYEDEASLISKWTLKCPNIETGGDLFGLWLSENEVVIQAVLGPGQNCRRTATSFFQNEQYLSTVGGLLTNNQGLCNIGSWHSHHTMNLPDPSRGDRDTVWRHLPTPGRFLLLIATIETKTGAPKVQMGFNLFESTNEGNKVIPMKLNILQGQSPIRANKAITCQLLEGAEVTAERHSKKTPYSEPHGGHGRKQYVESGLTWTPEVVGQKVNGQPNRLKPDVEQRYDDSFRGQESARRGHRRSHDQNITCDAGVRSSFYNYNTFPRSHHSQTRASNPKNQRRALTFSVYDLPNGRQEIRLYHYGHPYGSCEECHNIVVRWDGGINVEHRQGEVDCCTIL